MEIQCKYCRYCGRLLKSKESIERGYGLVCYEKHIKSLRRGGLLGLFRDKDKAEHSFNEGVSSEICNS